MSEEITHRLKYTVEHEILDQHGVLAVDDGIESVKVEGVEHRSMMSGRMQRLRYA